MTSQVSYHEPERRLAIHCESALPLALLISIMFAAYASVNAYLCGCSMLEILWAYSRSGIAALLSIVILILVVRR